MSAPFGFLAGMQPTSGVRMGLVAMLVVGLTTVGSRCRAEDKEEPLPPENVSLKTTDGVALAATYYPSREGKDAAAVILLHAGGGQRTDLGSLALLLQRQGSAVIVPDLRGHGESIGQFANLRPQDYADMVRRDLEAVKGFLMQRNNAGELNIERLGVIGVEMGATLAVNWAALDWSWPELATGKQGQDVKAIALVSPEWSHKGLQIGEAVAQPGVKDQISVLLVAGRRNAKFFGEARRLHKTFARHHDISPSLPLERRTLFFQTPATSLQGMPLVNEKSMEVDAMIAEFVQLRLQDPPFAWQMRKPAL